MTYTSGGSVQAQDYNTFSSNTNAVWNTLYGQTAVATVAVGNIVYANNWATLNSTISNMAAHQGTTITTRTGPTPGQTISVQSNIATDITSCTTNEYNAASLGSQYTGWTGNASATSGAGTGGTWTITFTDTVTFASAASANYFFNCGGLIKIQFGKSSTGAAGDSEWNNFISNVCGAIYLSGTAASKTINGTTYTGTTKIGGTGTPSVLATGTGYAQLTSSATTIYTQTDPSLTSSQVSISAAYNGSTTLTSVTTWTSGSTNAISGGTATTGTSFGTAPATVVTYFPPETTYLTNTWGTPTVASSFSVVNNAQPAPTITGVSPGTGSTTGGTNITISGTNFYNVTSVTVGGNAVTNLSVNSTTSITATTPAGSAGSATVTVTTNGGTATDTGGFNYVASGASTALFYGQYLPGSAINYITRINKCGALIGTETSSSPATVCSPGAGVGSTGIFWGPNIDVICESYITRLNKCGTQIGSRTTIGQYIGARSAAKIGSNATFYGGYTAQGCCGTPTWAVTRINTCGTQVGGTTTIVSTCCYPRSAWKAGASVGSIGVFYGGAIPNNNYCGASTQVTRINACGTQIGTCTSVGSRGKDTHGGAGLCTIGLFYAGFDARACGCSCGVQPVTNIATRINACGAQVGSQTNIGTARGYLAGAGLACGVGVFYGGLCFYSTTSYNIVTRINKCGAQVGSQTNVGTARPMAGGSGAGL